MKFLPPKHSVAALLAIVSGESFAQTPRYANRPVRHVTGVTQNVAAPAATPKSVIATLHQATVKAM